MTSFNSVLLAILLVVVIILIIIAVVLCIKLLYTVDKMNIILTDMEKKLKSVNGVFNAIDVVTDAFVSVSDSFTKKLAHVVEKMFQKKKKEEK